MNAWRESWRLTAAAWARPILIGLLLGPALLLALPRAFAADSARISVRGDFDYPPYEYLDKDGLPAGFNVELFQAVARTMGLDPDIRLGPWNKVRAALESGETDALTGMYHSEERAREVEFSAPFILVYQTVFARESSPVESIDDCRDKSVLVQQGDIMHDFARDNLKDATIVPVESQIDALRLLASGNHDCALLAQLQGQYLIQKYGLSNVKVAGVPLEPRKYCFAVKKGDTALVEKLNEGLRIVRFTGQYDAIYDRWFGAYKQKTFMERYYKHVLWMIGIVLCSFCAMLLWNISLARQVALRTGDLQDELRQRFQAESALSELNRSLERLVDERTLDLRRKTDELESANKRLLDLDELKSDFLSSVSHELRTPLTSVLGFAKLINRDFTASFRPLARGDGRLEMRGDRIRENLEIIEHEGERLMRMINDFLDLTKIESGRVEWRDSRVSLAGVIGRAADAVRGLFLRKPEVRLSVVAPQDLPLVTADPDKMEQVFVNLLNNAIKFTEQGEVRVEARLARSGILEARVTDSGVGIPEGELRRIFDKFHQVRRDDTLREKPLGTGLGLAICRQIVEHYHGRIWAESEPGRGSAFVFELPAAPALPDEAGIPAAEAAAPEREGLPESGIPRILVVDDDPATRSYLAQLLEGEGYRVDAAPDGESALEMARALHPDLVTMDILMPGLDGRAVIGRLRRVPELMRIPILVISVLQEDVFGGEDAALRKPIDHEALLDTVRSLLARSRSQKPVMVLHRDVSEQADPFYTLFAGQIRHCGEEEFWRRLNAGFEGTVVLPAWAARELDLAALTARKRIQVLLLPDREPPGSS
ncbi:MAG: transporter substrate-binding domain-containing protein [Thermodesulfobacteriota bacterium]